MFACVYFEKDASLTVANEQEVSKVLTEFKNGHCVEMKWRTGKTVETFNGVIINTGDQESMNRFARQAYSSVLKDHIAPGTPAPEELLNFRLNTKKSNGTKRQHVPTKRLEESKQQEETLSPKKRKKEARQQVDKQQKTVSPKKKEAKKSTPKEKNPTQASVCQDSMLEMCKNMTGLFQQFKGQTQSALTVTPLKDKTQLADQIQSAEIPKAKTPSADQIQSEEIPKTKTQSADQIQSEEIPKTKTQSADQIQSEEIPKTKTQSADQIQSEEIPKTKTQLADQIQSEVKPKDKTQSEENQKVQTRPSENCTGTITTPLTDTWGACHRALSFVDEVSTEQMPVASANVLSTIRGLLNPEFLDFMRRLSDHMESSTCPHTCMKVMMEKNVSANPDQMNHTVQQGFLAQLADLNSIEPAYQTDNDVHIEGNFGLDGTGSSVFEPNNGSSQQTPGLSQSVVANSLGTSPIPFNGQAAHTSSKEETVHSPRRTSPRKKTSVKSNVCSSPVNPVSLPASPLPGNSQTTDMLSPSRTSPRKKTACTPNVRSSPMNPVRSSPLAESSQSSDMVKLVTNKELSISVDRQGLRRACQEATIKKDNAGYILMYKMLDLVFSLEELAESRGLGIGKPRPGEEHKPVLDAGKIAVLKEYVHFWTKKNLATTFSEKRLNKAITERSHYARNQVKRQLDKSKI